MKTDDEHSINMLTREIQTNEKILFVFHMQSS